MRSIITRTAQGGKARVMLVTTGDHRLPSVTPGRSIYGTPATPRGIGAPGAVDKPWPCGYDAIALRAPLVRVPEAIP